MVSIYAPEKGTLWKTKKLLNPHQERSELKQEKREKREKCPLKSLRLHTSDPDWYINSCSRAAFMYAPEKKKALREKNMKEERNGSLKNL
jgi:hypothetical protein